jgi:hypothetical protein
MTLTRTKPLELELADGRVYRFLLSAGGIKRIKQRLNVASLQELLNRDAIDCAIPMLWEAMLDKPKDMTEESFSDLLPAHLESLIKCVMHLLNISMPDNIDRPTGAGETVHPATPAAAIQ